ncbi:hypothetical protein Vafri_20423, partial [Volvox africanus]
QQQQPQQPQPQQQQLQQRPSPSLSPKPKDSPPSKPKQKLQPLPPPPPPLPKQKQELLPPQNPQPHRKKIAPPPPPLTVVKRGFRPRSPPPKDPLGSLSPSLTSTSNGEVVPSPGTGGSGASVNPAPDIPVPAVITMTKVQNKYFVLSPYPVMSFFQSDAFCAQQGANLARWNEDTTLIALQQLCLIQGLDCWYGGTVVGGIFCPIYLGKQALLTAASCGTRAHALCVLPEAAAFWTQG